MFEFELENYEPIQYRGSDIPACAIQCKSDEVAIDDGCYLDLAIANKQIDYLYAKFQFEPYRWQRDAYLRYYGWRKPDGSYRFEYIICFIPKKNGKSFWISSLLAGKIWELEGKNIYSVAVNAKQAGLVMEGVIELFKKSKTVRQYHDAGVVKWFSSPARKEIINSVKGNRYIALADSPKANDGIVASGVLVVDEIHRIENRVFDIVDGSTANIPGALKVIISTSGDGDRSHCSFHQYKLAKQVLSGELIDTSILPIIYEYEDQKTRDPKKILSMEALMSCNPVLHEDEAARKKAERELVRERINPRIDYWRRMRLDVWCHEDGQQFIDPDLWASLAIDRIPETELALYPCFLGLDMSRCIDLTAITLWHELPDGRIYQQPIAIMPADRLTPASIEDDVDYCKFAENNELTVCDGKTISDEYVAELLLKLTKQYPIKGFGYDPAYADYIAKKMEQAGITPVIIQQQNNRQQTVGINTIEQMVIEGRICHAKPVNELYLWQLKCCNRITTAKDVTKLVKKHSNKFGRNGKGRIDSVDAAVNAALVWRHHRIEGDNEPFVY